MLLLWIMGAVTLPVTLTGQEHAAVSALKDFIRVDSPVVALEHVRVIDGTGAPARPDQTIVISAGTITAMRDSNSVKVPETAHRVDFTGHTAIPGLVGMHDHLFYVTSEVNDNFLAHDMPLSSAYADMRRACLGQNPASSPRNSVKCGGAG